MSFKKSGISFFPLFIISSGKETRNGINVTEITPHLAADKMGIIEYVEPQCLMNPKYKKDKRSDIYNLGVLFWEISSGNPPFSNYDHDLLAIQITNDLRENPIEGTPSWYQQLYQKCWDNNPENRPDIDQVYNQFNSYKHLELQISNNQNDDIITSELPGN